MSRQAHGAALPSQTVLRSKQHQLSTQRLQVAFGLT